MGVWGVADGHAPPSLEPAEYERRHKMSSEEMANLMDNNAIPATMEFIKWYHTYDVLRLFFAQTPTTGTPGTTTNMSTNAV